MAMPNLVIKKPKRGVRRIKGINYFPRKVPLGMDYDGLLAALSTRTDLMLDESYRGFMAKCMAMVAEEHYAKEENKATSPFQIKTTIVKTETKTRSGDK